ncbi:hypothetical protein BJX70DRAFT_219080 [Aspergillus crustosus]
MATKQTNPGRPRFYRNMNELKAMNAVALLSRELAKPAVEIVVSPYKRYSYEPSKNPGHGYSYSEQLSRSSNRYRSRSISDSPSESPKSATSLPTPSTSVSDQSEQTSSPLAKTNSPLGTADLQSPVLKSHPIYLPSFVNKPLPKIPAAGDMPILKTPVLRRSSASQSRPRGLVDNHWTPSPEPTDLTHTGKARKDLTSGSADTSPVAGPSRYRNRSSIPKQAAKVQAQRPTVVDVLHQSNPKSNTVSALLHPDPSSGRVPTPYAGPSSIRSEITTTINSTPNQSLKQTPMGEIIFNGPSHSTRSTAYTGPKTPSNRSAIATTTKLSLSTGSTEQKLVKTPMGDILLMEPSKRRQPVSQARLTKTSIDREYDRPRPVPRPRPRPRAYPRLTLPSVHPSQSKAIPEPSPWIPSSSSPSSSTTPTPATLLTLTHQIRTQTTLACTLFTKHASTLTNFETHWISSILNHTDSLITEILTFLEPHRVEAEIHNGKPGVRSKVKWCVRDGKIAREKMERLIVFQKGVEGVLGRLWDLERVDIGEGERGEQGKKTAGRDLVEGVYGALVSSGVAEGRSRSAALEAASASMVKGASRAAAPESPRTDGRPSQQARNNPVTDSDIPQLHREPQPVPLDNELLEMLSWRWAQGGSPGA